MFIFRHEVGLERLKAKAGQREELRDDIEPGTPHRQSHLQGRVSASFSAIVSSFPRHFPTESALFFLPLLLAGPYVLRLLAHTQGGVGFPARQRIARDFGTPQTGLLGSGISVVQPVTLVTEHSPRASRGRWSCGEFGNVQRPFCLLS